MMAMTSDVDPEQDFHVADLTSITIVNSLVCKSTAAMTANNFLFHGLTILRNTKNATVIANDFMCGLNKD